MVAYRLRIELPDRPGALSGVSGEIAASGANITSVDVHEVDGASVVDEVVVDVGDDWLPARLAAALAAEGTGSLLSSRRIDLREDPVATVLDAVALMVGGGRDDLERHCSRALLGVAQGSSADVLDGERARVDPVAKVALERGATIVTRSGPLGDGWVLSAVDEPTDPRAVAVVVRPFDARFSATEIGRVEAVLRIRRQLLGTRATSA